MQLNRYILASKAHVECMHVCMAKLVSTTLFVYCFKYAWLRVYYLHGLEPFGGWGGGGVRSTEVINLEGSSIAGSQDSIFLFLKPLSNQPSGCNDGLLMAFQSIEGALCC